MQTHRQLTVLAVILLAATFLINYYHQRDPAGDGFNYAYIPGIAMLFAFMLSFFLFSRDRRRSDPKK